MFQKLSCADVQGKDADVKRHKMQVMYARKNIVSAAEILQNKQNEGIAGVIF